MPNDAPEQQQITQPPATAKREIVVHDEGQFAMLMDTGQFAQLQRIGKMYASSKMVPSHFQGDEASCMVAVQMAMRLGVDPFMFLQKTYVVSGKPGMEAPLAIALINTRGPFKGPIQWTLVRDPKGKITSCTAYAFHRDTNERCESTVTWEMVEAEGWHKKPGSKWMTIPEQMFKYRTASWLGRLYCPEVLMGMETADELVDAVDVTTGQPPEGKRPGRVSLKERMGAIDGEAVQVKEPENPAQPAQDAAGAAQPTEAAQPPAQPAGNAQGAPAEPVMPFAEVLKMAKSAKTADQADIVRDAMNGQPYTPEQVEEVRVILNSKKFAD